MNRLTESELAKAAEQLSSQDRHLRFIFSNYGPPPLWARRPNFSTLIHIILEQQVSLASAASMLARLRSQIKPFQPEQFVQLGSIELRRLGLTRQKTSYCLHLAESIVEKRIKLSQLAKMEDEEAKETLMKLKGIGSWTADIYLLMALLRPDVWPEKDLALASAVRGLKKMSAQPTPEELGRLASKWRPYRSVAARMLWQYYLAQRAPRPKR